MDLSTSIDAAYAAAAETEATAAAIEARIIAAGGRDLVARVELLGYRQTMPTGWI